MKQLPTAEQFLRFKSDISEDKTSVEYLTDCEVEEIMIEFAKMHVQAALEAASERNRRYFILQAYPESNIKQMRGRRVYCEDISPVLNSIRASKKHGKTVEINGLQYEHIGDDMLYCLKTSTIKKA